MPKHPRGTIGRRQAADQTMINKWAAEYFNKESFRFLNQFLGHAPRFTFDEYYLLQDVTEGKFRLPGNAGGIRGTPWAAKSGTAVAQFYLCALTLDQLLHYLRTLDRMVSNLKENDDDMLTYLKSEIPDLTKMTKSDTSKAELLSYAVTAAVLRLMQGIHLKNPEKTITENDWSGDVKDDGEVNDIGKALKRSGALVAIMRMVDKLVKHFKVATNGMYTVGYGTDDFMSNMNTGPMRGTRGRCPKGMMPEYYKVDKDGVNLGIASADEAFVTINGKTYLASNIDDSLTQCKPAIAVEFGARRVRKSPARTRDSKGRFLKSSSSRMHAMKLPAGMAARRAPRKRTTYRARGITRPRLAPWNDMYDLDSGLESVNPLDFEARRVRRPRARAQTIDPVKFAALQIREAMLARRTRRARY